MRLALLGQQPFPPPLPACLALQWFATGAWVPGLTPPGSSDLLEEFIKTG
jgi:hypothetical protein